MTRSILIRLALTSASLFLVATSAAPGSAAPQQKATAEPGQSAQAGLTWSDASRASLDSVLGKRADHGLDRVDFLGGPSDAEQPAARDARYSRAALGFASALARGQVDPTKLHDVYTLGRPNPDLQTGLRKALSQGTLDQWLSGLAPQDDEYLRLSKAYLANRDTAGSAQESQPIASSASIQVGKSDPRVAEIARQLVDDGYLSALPDGAGASPMTYTQTIADAIKALQSDYGIAADGVFGPDTLKVLNMGPSDRARALAVALERRRWLTRTPPATRIDVNTASAQMRYWRDGKLVDERRVIVGQAGQETPMLGSPIFRLVANPDWTVPKSIQNGEMAKLGASYLQAHNMVMRDGWIVQQPGPENALGLVKFDMANQHAIYLHDTSSPELFNRSQRHLSHGCVRVYDALGFADMLAEQEGVGEKWQQARSSGEKTFVKLPREIPVRLIYGNVFVDDADRVVFRTDPYGWNERVAKALGFAGADRRAAKAQAVDVGP